MKRVRCPKCDNYITFDETKYSDGQSLVFICDNCKKQFSIRIGKSKLKPTQKDEVIDENNHESDYGSIVVIENVFGFKQIFPLQLGNNTIGRRSKGTDIVIPIETNDPSVDRTHCTINVRQTKQGEIKYTLSDNDSLTGTFLLNELIGPKEKVNIEDGAIVTIGATTFILRTSGSEEE